MDRLGPENIVKLIRCAASTQPGLDPKVHIIDASDTHAILVAEVLEEAAAVVRHLVKSKVAPHANND